MSSEIEQLSLSCELLSASRTNGFPQEEWGWKKPREWESLESCEEVLVAFPGEWRAGAIGQTSLSKGRKSVVVIGDQFGELIVERLEALRIRTNGLDGGNAR